jgi:dTDP-4-dehydrorhamnose reductase
MNIMQDWRIALKEYVINYYTAYLAENNIYLAKEHITI